MGCPKKVVALLGPLGAGKDTMAKHLVDSHGFRRFAFADEIKRNYYSASGHSEEAFKAARGTPLEAEIRSGLWQYSDRIKRERGQLYFINIVVGAITDCPFPVVVTDIRTIEELDAMRSMGAKIVLVLKVAKDEGIPAPAPDAMVPGARITYGDLRSSDPVFYNRESEDPKQTADAMEAFCLGVGMLEGEMEVGKP